MWNIYKESVGKNLSDAMEHYVGFTLGLNMKEMSNKKLRLFQKDTIAFLAWCHLKRSQNKGASADKDVTYEKYMPALLAAYVDSSLCLSKIMSVERRSEESATILMKVSLLLSCNIHLYLDVILQLKCLDPTHLDLLKPLCRKCLTQKPNSDPETYTKYLLVQRKLASLWPKDLSTELLEASMILPPTNYLKWLEKMDTKALSSLNIENTKNDRKMRDELMSHQNISVLESIVNTSFKMIKVSPRIAESIDSDSEDIICLSDDEHVVKKKCDAESISSSDDEDVSFWSQKRDIIIDDPSSSSMEASDSDDVVLMETESVGDSTSESENVNISSEKGDDIECQNSSEAIDLTCEDEEASKSIVGFVDDDVSEKIESSVVEVSTSVDKTNIMLTSPEPKVSNLKRKYDDDSDDDDDEVEDSESHRKRVKLALGLEDVVDLDIEDSKEEKSVLNATKPVEDLLLINQEIEAAVVMEETDITKPVVVMEESNVTRPVVVIEESNITKPAVVMEESNVTRPVVVMEETDITKPVVVMEETDITKPVVVMEESNVTRPVAVIDESNITKPAVVMEESNVTKPVEELLPSSHESKSDVMEELNVTKLVDDVPPSSQEAASESDVVELEDAGTEEAPIKDAIEEKVSEDFDTSNLAITVREESEKKESFKSSVSKEKSVKDNPCENILEEKMPEDFNDSTLSSAESPTEELEGSDTKESVEVLSIDDDDDSMKEDSSGNIFEEKFPDDFYTSFVTVAEGARGKPQESEKKEINEILFDDDGTTTFFDGKASKFIDLMTDKYESKEKECIMVDDNLSRPSFESDEVEQLPAIAVAKVDSDAVGISSPIQMYSSQGESSIQNFMRQIPAKRLQSPTLSKGNTKSPVTSKSKNHLFTGEREELLIQLPETPIGSPLTNNSSSVFASSQLSDLSCTSMTDISKAEPLENTAMQVNKIGDKSSDSLEVSEIKISAESTAEEAPRQKYSLRSLEKVSKLAQPAPKTRIRKPATKVSKPTSAAEIQSCRNPKEEFESSAESNVVTLKDVTDIKPASKEDSETSQAVSSQSSNASLKKIVQPKATSRIPRWTAKEEEPESQDNLNPALRRSARILGKGSKN